MTRLAGFKECGKRDIGSFKANTAKEKKKEDSPYSNSESKMAQTPL